MMRSPISKDAGIDLVTATVVALENYRDNRFEEDELIDQLVTIMNSVQDTGTARMVAKQIADGRDSQSWVQNFGWDVLYAIGEQGRGPWVGMHESVEWAVWNTTFAPELLHEAFASTVRYRSVKLGENSGEEYLKTCATYVSDTTVLRGALRRIHHFSHETRVAILTRYSHLTQNVAVNQALEDEVVVDLFSDDGVCVLTTRRIDENPEPGAETPAVVYTTQRIDVS
jgi:hypothetical protein